MLSDLDLFRFREEKSDLKFIILDTETSGLSNFFSLCWDVSWIIVHGKNIIDQQQRFPFIENLKVSKGAAEVTGFKYSEYKDKSEDALTVWNDLAKYLYNPSYYIVGMNILNFDIYQLASFQRYLGMEPDYSYITRVYDLLSLGRAYKTNERFPSDKSDITPWMYRFASLKKKGLKANLDQLCKDFGVQVDESKRHTGLHDVILTYQVFRKLYWAMEVF